jgi:osmotically-inducible protein OsmY
VGDRAVIIGRNTEVYTRGGRKVGTIDHVAVDPVSMAPRMLVVRMPGIRRRRVMVTADEVLSWERTGIILTLRRHDLHALPPYTPYADDKTVVAGVRGTLQESGLRISGLDLASSDGHVTLRGHADSDAARRAADRLVRTVPGVVTLDNELTTDRILATRVQARLDDEPIAGLYPVKIAAERARVRVSGTVPNSAIHAIVLDVVNQTPGVNSVDDQVELHPEAFQGAAPAAAQT